MSARIHLHLDGELPLSSLTPREREQVAEYRRALGETLAVFLDEEAPDVTDRVMSQLRPHRPTALVTSSADPLQLLRAFGTWLWTPRSFKLNLRPAWAAALLVAAIALGPGVLTTPARGTPIQVGGTVMATSVVDGRALVSFRLDAPGAHAVRLAGDFTGWKPGPELTESSPGIWSVEVPLSVGLHDYAFIVDGSRWVQDPLAERVDDGFGGSNSRVAVLLPGSSNET